MPISDTARQAQRAAILTALQQGATRTAAAEAAGISRATLWSWCNEDSTFLDAVARAEAEAQRYYEARIHSEVTAERSDWHAAAWWLERRRRADYGPELNLRAISTEQLRELLPADTQPTALPSARDLTPDEENAIDSVFTDRE